MLRGVEVSKCKERVREQRCIMSMRRSYISDALGRKSTVKRVRLVGADRVRALDNHGPRSSKTNTGESAFPGKGCLGGTAGHRSWSVQLQPCRPWSSLVVLSAAAHWLDRLYISWS